MDNRNDIINTATKLCDEYDLLATSYKIVANKKAYMIYGCGNTTDELFDNVGREVPANEIIGSEFVRDIIERYKEDMCDLGLTLNLFSKQPKTVLHELIEKGVISIEEGDFIYSHIKSQNRTKYTFERDMYTITIDIHGGV